MSELRETLERESERFVLSPGGLDRLHRRRRRRERNRRLGAGLLTLALAAGSTLFAVRAFQHVPPEPRPADQPRVVETASIGVRPAAMAVTQEGVWVVSSQDRTLRRLHPLGGEVIDEISLPGRLGPPGSLTAWRGSIWVQTGFVSGPPEVRPAVVRIDPTTKALTTFPLDRGEHVGVTLGAGALWSANSETGEVSRRDLSTGEVTATALGPIPPVALAFGEEAVWSLGRGRGDVVPPAPGTIARIDARAPSATLSTQVGVNPTDLAVREGAVWVVNPASSSVLRIDTETVTITDEIPVPGTPSQISAGRSGVWVLDRNAGMIFRIDPDRARITGSVKVGPGALAVAAGRDGVWAARSDGTILRLEA
jgi:streptogramin lyase